MQPIWAAVAVAKFQTQLHLSHFSHQIDPGHNLLAKALRRDAAKKCLVLDLDETLVHSSFKVCVAQIR